MNRTKIKDIDLAKVETALRRASEKARRIAVATHTPFVVYKNDKKTRQMVVKEKQTKYGKKDEHVIRENIL
jgi:hypothetical protein